MRDSLLVKIKISDTLSFAHYVHFLERNNMPVPHLPIPIDLHQLEKDLAEVNRQYQDLATKSSSIKLQLLNLDRGFTQAEKRKGDIFKDLTVMEAHIKSVLSEPDSQDVLEKELDGLGISQKILKVLRAQKITKIGHVTERTEAEILSLPNFNRKYMPELKDVLTSRGLTFSEKKR